MEDTVFEKIYKVVRKIPRGKVATYGQIAALAGNPRWARVVGYALHVNPDPSEIPCYRVVNRHLLSAVKTCRFSCFPQTGLSLLTGM